MGPETPQSEAPFELPLGGTPRDLSAATSVPQVPQKLSRKEIGQLRRRHLTVVNSTVTACGHKFSNRVPSTNCFWCYQAYFKTCADLDEIHQQLRVGGRQVLTAKYGKKFVKMFGQFLNDELLPEVCPCNECQPRQQKGTDVVFQETQGTGSSESSDSTPSVVSGEIQSN